MPPFHWITGPTRSGKTTRLLAIAQQWIAARPVEQPRRVQPGMDPNTGAKLLILTATGENRLALNDRLQRLRPDQNPLPVHTTTPIGFVQTEVQLFWALIRAAIQSPTQFPRLLRPELEAALATELWQPELDAGLFQIPGQPDRDQVRRGLDWLQLAAFAGVEISQIAPLLTEGLPQPEEPVDWAAIAAALQRWQTWCWARGFVTYSLLCDLYWRILLPHPTYQTQLTRRYWGALADDVDDYPAIAADWLRVMHRLNLPIACTYSPTGLVRWGQGADPDHLQGLATAPERQADQPAELEYLEPPAANLAAIWGAPTRELVADPLSTVDIPPIFQSLQTTSRADLLRQTATAIATLVNTQAVAPGDIAIIAPGLDDIARYTLPEILASQAIPSLILRDQRPLSASPLVRSLLTLLALVYPDLGNTIDGHAIAEMLITLSQSPATARTQAWVDRARIDPVRAELLADYCFKPDRHQPQLLPHTVFARWDRLGHVATTAYTEILDWLTSQIQQHTDRLLPDPVTLLDRAIQRFLWSGSTTNYAQLNSLRELMETAQHFWQIDDRRQSLSGSSRPNPNRTEAIAAFINLIQADTVAADPYPTLRAGQRHPAVLLSTVYQYRSHRLHHPWQFWLDAGSSRWLTGDDARLGAPVFWRDRPLRPWTETDLDDARSARLQRILPDLLGRTGQQIVLCHSDLSTHGQDQTGPLLALINQAPAWNYNPLNPSA